MEDKSVKVVGGWVMPRYSFIDFKIRVSEPIGKEDLLEFQRKNFNQPWNVDEFPPDLDTFSCTAKDGVFILRWLADVPKRHHKQMEEIYDTYPRN